MFFRHKMKSYARNLAKRKGASNIQTHVYVIDLTAAAATFLRVERFDG